jgi:hypothetical protein
MKLTRVRARHGAAVLSAAMAGIYYLIGLRVLDIGGSSTGEAVDLTMFGAAAGTAFLGLAALLTLSDRRWVWFLALLVQVFVYVVYVATSAVREPPFELWGITLRILQLPVVLALIYLVLPQASHGRIAAGGPGGRPS